MFRDFRKTQLPLRIAAVNMGTEMLIKELPEGERPREKIFSKGAAALSDAEILAVFFSTGRRGKSAIDLGREMIAQFGSLRNLSRASIEELCQIDGIGPAKAAQLAGVFEFGKRLSSEEFAEREISDPESVLELMGADLQRLSQESVRVILLNNRNKLLKVEEIFRGSGTQCIASPSEILRSAIGIGARKLILVHNHPSGDPSPSEADILLTKKLRSAAETLDISLVDHVIIGTPGKNHPEAYYSFREGGLL